MSKRSCAAAESAESAVLRMARVNCIVCAPVMFYYISFWLLFTGFFVIFVSKKKYRTIFLFYDTSSSIFPGKFSELFDFMLLELRF